MCAIISPGGFHWFIDIRLQVEFPMSHFDIMPRGSVECIVSKDVKTIGMIRKKRRSETGGCNLCLSICDIRHMWADHFSCKYLSHVRPEKLANTFPMLL